MGLTSFQPDAALEAYPETRIADSVFPASTNHYDTLFGGQAMAWMDQAAFICAPRWCRRKVVTAHGSAVDFHHAVRVGAMVEIIARVGRTSTSVHIELWVEPMDRAERNLVCPGDFVLVALDDQNRVVAMPQPASISDISKGLTQ
jgi:acyl-CoA hydrolase